MSDFKENTVVWVKYYDYPWWPGLIWPEELAPPEAKQTKPKGRSTLTRFFGDGTVCWARPGELKPWNCRNQKKYMKSKSVRDAVQEALYHLKMKRSVYDITGPAADDNDSSEEEAGGDDKDDDDDEEEADNAPGKDNSERDGGKESDAEADVPPEEDDEDDSRPNQKKKNRPSSPLSSSPMREKEKKRPFSRQNSSSSASLEKRPMQVSSPQLKKRLKKVVDKKAPMKRKMKPELVNSASKKSRIGGAGGTEQSATSAGTTGEGGTGRKRAREEKVKGVKNRIKPTEFLKRKKLAAAKKPKQMNLRELVKRLTREKHMKEQKLKNVKNLVTKQELKLKKVS
uniref:PWWP domain-containing protein n=1 Tax=Lotharella globosa TaxID=91324 RepID=A0A6V3M1P1_9EUKA